MQPVTGSSAEGRGLAHPEWTDGKPILVGDSVERNDPHDGSGLVVGVRFREVAVTWVLGFLPGDEIDWSDDEVLAPEELRRVPTYDESKASV